jgi:hypothetical protein
MIDKLFQDKNKIVWVRQNNFNYPRTALYLPMRYRKEAMCEAAIASLEDTMLLTKPTLKSLPHTSGQK